MAEISKVDFAVTPESLENGKKQVGPVPKFKVTGTLATAVCPISQPFTGEVTVEDCDSKIKSVELQLVRVETCGKNPFPDSSYFYFYFFFREMFWGT